MESKSWTIKNRQGLEIACESRGSPDNSPVILLHGGGQTRHSWGTAMEALASAGYHAISYDTRGHGESDWSPTGDYSYASLSGDLVEIAAPLDRPIALVGASLGAITAFRVTAEAKLDVAALVLVDMVLTPSQRGGKRIMSFMNNNSAGFATVEEAANAISAYFPERPRPDDLSGLHKNLRKGGDGRLYWHWDPRLLGDTRSLTPPDISWAIEMTTSIDCPLLVVRGGRSDVVDDDGIAEMKRLIPQTQIFNVENAGHMVVGTDNDAFNAGVMDFVRRNLPASSNAEHGQTKYVL